MAEYINKELMLKKIKEKATTKYDWSEKIDVDDFEAVIKELPVVDVVEVVRCKDCKYQHLERELFDSKRTPFCTIFNTSVKKEYYCCRGERKLQKEVK